MCCQFCGQFETTDHLFVTCPLASTIWTWIANYNGFHFDCTTVSDLWSFDNCLPFRDTLIFELIRAATLWIIWLTRNNCCFTNTVTPPIQNIGSKIIALTSFWCQSRQDDTYYKLTLIMPMNVSLLTQADPITIPSGTDTSSEDVNSWDSEVDPCRGLGESDLAEYLRDRTDLDEMDAAITISSDPTQSNSSFADSSVAP